TVPAVTGRNVILTTAVRALLEPKTVIALLRVALLHDRFIPLRRLQQPLTTPSIVLDHTTITVGFAPEDIGKPAARAEHLHRFTVRVRFRLPHLRVMQ